MGLTSFPSVPIWLAGQTMGLGTLYPPEVILGTMRSPRHAHPDFVPFGYSSSITEETSVSCSIFTTVQTWFLRKQDTESGNALYAAKAAAPHLQTFTFQCGISTTKTPPRTVFALRTRPPGQIHDRNLQANYDLLLAFSRGRKQQLSRGETALC